VLIGIAIFLLIYNATQIDFEHLLSEKNKTAWISVLAPACVILLLSILLISRKIESNRKAK